MTPRWQWAVFAYVVLWAVCVPSCAHKYRRTENAYLQESERIKWDTTAEKHEKQQQQTARDEQRKVTGKARARVKKPDGTTIDLDLDWVDEAVAKYTARAESDSVSRSAAGGEKQKQKDAGSNVVVQGDIKPGWPWFRIGAGVAIVALLCYLVYRWRRRRSLLGL